MDSFLVQLAVLLFAVFSFSGTANFRQGNAQGSKATKAKQSKANSLHIANKKGEKTQDTVIPNLSVMACCFTRKIGRFFGFYAVKYFYFIFF